jgi:hypothetical protein
LNDLLKKQMDEMMRELLTKYYTPLQLIKKLTPQSGEA